MQGVIVVGGGSNGVLISLYLLRRYASMRVTLVGQEFGDNLVGPGSFLQLLLPWIFSGRVICIPGELSNITTTKGRCIVSLSDGKSLISETVIIIAARTKAKGGADFSDPWFGPVPVDRHSDVVILGTGYLMVRRALQLIESGHRGRIIALSRRGLLPLVEGTSHPVRIDTADLPLGTSMSYGLRWLRVQIAWQINRGGEWRDVVDGLTSVIADWWRSAPKETRGRYLRHAHRIWQACRHRVTQEQFQSLDAAQKRGQLVVVKGRLTRYQRRDRNWHVEAECFDGAMRHWDAADITDCRGMRLLNLDGDLTLPVMELVTRGVAQLDPLGISLQRSVEGQQRLQPGAYVLESSAISSDLETGSRLQLGAYAGSV